MPELFDSNPGQRPSVEEKYKGHQTWQEAYENPDEVYTAKEIFDLIQVNEFNKLNPEKIKQELLEKGEKEEDVDLSLQLMACIGALDAAVFPGESIPLNFSIIDKEEGGDYFAAYESLENNPQEGYTAFVRGGHTKIQEILTFSKVKLINEVGRLTKDTPLLTLEAKLLQTAIHEVRHRLQFRKNPKMFLVEDIKDFKDPLKGMARYVKRLFKEEIKLEEAGQNRKQKIDYYKNPMEFDARLVDHLAIMKIHQGVTLQEFVDLVKIQSEK